MSYTHLNAFDRMLISILKESGRSHREIGSLLNRSHTTISRELARNTDDPSHYDSHAAQVKAKKRTHSARHKRCQDNPSLMAQVRTWLEDDWSPEIIENRLKKDYPRMRSMRMSKESIYQTVYRDAAQGGKLFKHLWQQKKRRRPHQSRLKRTLIPHRISINERPAGANNRSRHGHWEGDTVEGAKGTGGLATYTDRKCRYLIARLLSDKRASTFSEAASLAFSWVPERLCKTVTFDNGSENAEHPYITLNTGLKAYFADPYSPWQRGTNEQINGLLRRYFPKGSDFRKLTQETVDAVVEKINKRPRKCLGYRAPYDVFADAMRGALAT